MKSLQKSRNKVSSTYSVKLMQIGKNAKNAIFLSILRGLLTDVERLRPGTKGLARDYLTLEARIEHEGIAFLGTALCTLAKAFDKGLDEGTFTCPPGFKTRKGSKLPLLFGGIFCEVFDDETGTIKECDLIEDVKILRQLLYFLEKVCAGFVSINYAREEDGCELYTDGLGSSPFNGRTKEPHQPCLPFDFNEA